MSAQFLVLSSGPSLVEQMYLGHDLARPGSDQTYVKVFEPFDLEAEPEAPEVPVCVEKAKLPKTRQVVRRPMTEEEAVMVGCIRCCVRFSPGHWDKRFMRELPEAITDKQAVQVWRIFKTYRRQIDLARCGITAETKEDLLRKAAVVVEAFQAGERDTARDGNTAEKGEG